MSIWMLLFTYGKRQIQVQKPQINQVQFNVQGHFHTYPVKILVFPSPTGYMLQPSKVSFMNFRYVP